ncbi:transglutaminase domain-containing protein [Ginsengibacter hankyongi]|uniref:Transglutaminase domain-containing protein n=1 Tax=Ginsengibacter hankyongi TaxID=2607284 RepID=A0A5J5IH97_9BACT|nr:transglutaminase-like domain-containing protein [Ginsengibacter hankyongi]KAA9039484.1 transglutaminase domain-containing protein [Ginsengibacter hankyongi]
MKTLAVVLCIICVALRTHAQYENDYAEADRIALNIPASQTNSTADIAAYINKNFDTDNKKVRAIYTWVISHIRYSNDSIHRVILNEDRDQLVTFALRRRKGVCENFAAIFDDICKKCGLRSFAVEGYTKQNSSVDRTSHAWNIVYIDKKWSAYDPTWDAGQSSTFYQPVRTNYFMIAPPVFIQTHMPFDPMFQLLDYPLTYKEFNNGSIRAKNVAKYFNYNDSINKYEKDEPLERYIGATERIQNNGAANNMISTKLSQLRLEIELIYQVKDSVLYNDAIADYNFATNEFNNFIAYRNNQFKPEKTDAQIQLLFDEVRKSIAAARKKLKEVNQSKAKLTLDTGDVEYAINKLDNHMKEQEVFFKNYKAPANNKQ